MADDANHAHKYYCSYCTKYIYGATPEILATCLNVHNSAIHPADCARWCAADIVRSTHYVGTSYVSEYLTVGEWGTAKNPPSITARDRIMLAKGLVRWDS
jgi:hypothetical protein